MKQPWLSPEGKAVWETEAQYWTFLRGAIRQIWSSYPLRKEWKKRQLRPLTKEEKESKLFHPSTKNVGQCSFCKEWMAGSKLECDHLIESEGCTSQETAESFLWHCAGLVGEDFRLACKPCHKVQSYSQKQGITFEEALIEKRTIEIMKTKTEKVWLVERGVMPESSAAKRRQQVKLYLQQEEVLDNDATKE